MDTKDAILDAFEREVTSSSYEQASIEDICRMANVSRRTFYRYFDGKLAAFDAALERDLIQPVHDIHRLINSSNLKSSSEIIYGRTLEKIFAKQDFYRKVFDRRNPLLLNRYIDKIRDINEQSFAKNVADPEELELGAYYVAVASAYVTAKWLEEGCRTPPEIQTQYCIRWFYGHIRELDKSDDRGE